MYPAFIKSAAALSIASTSLKAATSMEETYQINGTLPPRTQAILPNSFSNNIGHSDTKSVLTVFDMIKTYLEMIKELPVYVKTDWENNIFYILSTSKNTQKEDGSLDFSLEKKDLSALQEFLKQIDNSQHELNQLKNIQKSSDLIKESYSFPQLPWMKQALIDHQTNLKSIFESWLQQTHPLADFKESIIKIEESTKLLKSMDELKLNLDNVENVFLNNWKRFNLSSTTPEVRAFYDFKKEFLAGPIDPVTSHDFINKMREEGKAAVLNLSNLLRERQILEKGAPILGAFSVLGSFLTTTGLIGIGLLLRKIRSIN